MCATFTDDDVGKRVEAASGEALGVVTMAEADTLYVTANEGAVDTIKAVLDWEAETDETVSINEDTVEEVTAEVIRLEGDRSTQEGTDPVIDRDEDTESDLPEGEGRSGTGVQPETERMNESGEERHPDEETAADERPPEGDRTVTRDRGQEDDR